MRSFLIFVVLMFSLSSVYASDYVSNKDFNDAIKSGNVEFVRENISKVENVNSDDCFLCTAIDKKQNEILDILLEKCDPNAPETTLLPLYCALVVKNNYAVDKLLEAGADPNIDKHITPLLIYAIIDDNAHAVEKLLEAGADENVKFMKTSAIQFAFNSYTTSYDVEDAFINFWNKKYKIPPTDIDKVLDLLKNSKAGNDYYTKLMSANAYPFRIVYCDLDKLSTDSKNLAYLNSYNSARKQSTIYINNEYRNVEPEIIATMLAGTSINIDGRISVVEELVSYGVMANVWKEFVSNNPKLNDETKPLVKGYNGMLKILELDAGYLKKGDYNNLWALSGLLRGTKQTSKGFRNKDLNRYFEKD